MTRLMDRRLLGLLEARALRPLDAHFADLLLRHAPAPGTELALAAALVSRHTGDGHVCLPLARLADQVLFDESSGQRWRAPPLNDWRAALLASGVVGMPGDSMPLILDAADRLYLHRLWQDEADVARDLAVRAAPRADIDPAALHAPLRRLFPGTDTGIDPGGVGQRRAAAVAALHGLGIICGRPGTGKTHTVARLLALLMELSGDRPLRVALAAPTGKAAQRLAASLREATALLPTGHTLPATVPTLHRLLGLRPDGSARHDADHPLACDVLLIDEASMVDLPLLARTLRALPAAARLILLGDPNQLASVEAGAVLGDLCANAGGYGPTAAARLLAATGDAAPASKTTGGISDCVALLDHSYRFAGGGAIGRLAAAVNAGDVAAALACLQEGGAVRFEAVADPSHLAARLAAEVGPALQPLFDLADPAAALRQLGEFQVLTALREGAFGVTGVNATLERALHRRGLIRGQAAHYPGRPLLISHNDHALGLFNGDLGLLLPDAATGGTLRAWFAASHEAAPRAIAPARLPPHETAYALTVHKSQGSEFARVLLILPPQPSPLLTRELLYTALTRARDGVTVWGSEATLVAAIERRLERDSGLGDALRSA